MKPLLYCWLAFIIIFGSICAANSDYHPPTKLNIKPNIVSDNVWSYIAETNIYEHNLYLNQGISYSGLGGWDIGLSSYNTPLYSGGAQNYENDTYINASKTFTITPKDMITIGSQVGTTIGNNQHTLHMLHFGNIRHTINEWITAYVGPYYANANLTTTVNQVGVTTGVVLQIIPKQVELRGDYISGHQNVSGASTILQLYLTPLLSIYTGINIPETNSGNEFAGVVGFNISNK